MRMIFANGEQLDITGIRYMSVDENTSYQIDLGPIGNPQKFIANLKELCTESNLKEVIVYSTVDDKEFITEFSFSKLLSVNFSITNTNVQLSMSLA